MNTLFKAIVLAGVGGMLWYELNARNNLPELWQVFLHEIQHAPLLWLLAALALMPFNWLIETLKWHPFVQRYEPMPYQYALRAVLAGASLSFFSPNRLGEYGGRVLFVSPANQWKAFMAHLVGGLAQFLVLVVFGVAGAVYTLRSVWPFEEKWYGYSAVIAVFFCAMLAFFFFNMHRVLPVLRRIPKVHLIKRYVKDVWVLERFKQAELWQIFGWSVLRYGVSCCQYYFLLNFFGIKTGAIQGFSAIASIFLLQTCIPLPPVANFFMRGNVAIWVWSAFEANEVSSLAASFLLWIINLFLPALLGTFSLLHVNISKSLGYENE